MRHVMRAVGLSVLLALLCPGMLRAASAQVEISIVDEGGSAIGEGLVMFARVDDPTQTFTIGQNDAGLYADAVEVSGDETTWRITRVVATGYLPTKLSVRAAAGSRVAQEVQAVELVPGAPMPEITILAGGTTKIDLTLGERKVVMERQAQARAAEAAAEPEAAAAPAMDAAYAEALRLYAAGDVEGALPHFAQAARDNPASVEIHVTYAGVLFKAKRYDEFEPAARAALALAPDNRELWMMLYSTARTRGDMRAARDALLEIKQRGGSAAELGQHLEFVARKLGQSPDAIPAWEALLDLDPKNADACASLAFLYSDRRDRKRSDEYLSRAVQLAPGRAPELYLELGTKVAGSTAAGPAENARAIELYRKAIELDPALAPAHKSLGLALWKSEDVAGARKELEKYLELRPNAEDKDEILGYLARLPE